jgi:flagella basal body P-ring formation protein FlgA
MIRQATLIVVLALALPAALDAAEFAPRPNGPTVQFSDRFGGELKRVAASELRDLPRSTRPTLKAEATVVGDVVRIGDLIENAGDAAEVAIFRAPDLGQIGTVPVARVLEAVMPHQVLLVDTRGIAEVVVTRASRTIAGKEVEARILRALAGQSGLPDAKDLTIMLDNEVRSLQVEAAVTAELRIVRLSYEPRSGRFDVMFDLPGSTVARRLPLRFTGAIAESFEALVPTRQIALGEVLKEGDVTVARRPKNELAPNVVLGTEQAIGLAAKRVLRPGQIMRTSDLAKPQLVARNETVTITYEVPGIMLTIRGQALEPGGQGDLINVLNAQSKKTIQATVIGPGRVSVLAASPRITTASTEAR